MTKWIVVVLVVLVCAAASAWMLQSLGVVNFDSLVVNGLERIPALQDHVARYRLGQEAAKILELRNREVALLKAELAETRRGLEAERNALAAEKEALEAERLRLEQLRRQLNVQEESLASQVRNLQDFRRLQEVFAEMRPSEATPILRELDDLVVARLLGGMDDDEAAEILAELPPDRAAELSRLVGGISDK